MKSVLDASNLISDAMSRKKKEKKKYAAWQFTVATSRSQRSLPTLFPHW